ncbi:hypothetical protein BDY19DRAFT_938498, partial [Irpex rosettiformis]
APPMCSIEKYHDNTVCLVFFFRALLLLLALQQVLSIPRCPTKYYSAHKLRISLSEEKGLSFIVYLTKIRRFHAQHLRLASDHVANTLKETHRLLGSSERGSSTALTSNTVGMILSTLLEFLEASRHLSRETSAIRPPLGARRLSDAKPADDVNTCCK